jgi:hypothetical protein
MGTAVASVLTIAILWVGTQSDVLTLASGAAGDQLQNLVLDAARGVLTVVLGDHMFGVVRQTGTIGIAAAMLGLLAAAAGSIAGLRALAAASSRRRA